MCDYHCTYVLPSQLVNDGGESQEEGDPLGEEGGCSVSPSIPATVDAVCVCALFSQPPPC